MMKDWNIRDIENITEEQAQKMASDTKEIKGYSIYFIDFEGYFGFSYVVFKNGHHIYHANDYELHHKGKSRIELKMLYFDKINNILYTEKELAEPIKDYEEYNKKKQFLHNYYGMQTDYVSIFCCNPTDEQQKEFEETIKDMTYNPIAFAYMPDAEFVKHHIELHKVLTQLKNDLSGNYEYLKSAYLYEMHNHEYGINWQADYDVLSCFYDVEYHDCDLKVYFDNLKFTEVQKRAYLDARKQYYKETENY